MNKQNRPVGKFISCVAALLCITALSACATAGDNQVEQPKVAKPATITAAEWGSDPLPIPEERRHEPKYITIHHAGVTVKPDSDPYQTVRNLQAWGKKTVADGGKDWPDLPYHFLIASDGTIFEGRPVEYDPETNTTYKVRGHIGVELFGNFEEQRVSPQQVASVVKLVAWLSQQYGIPDELIRGHRDLAETDCPGADFYRYFEDGQLIGWIDQARAGKEPDIDLGPPLGGGPTEIIPMPKRGE
ncbi:MAG: peptidoglycan recognition family protein [Phycisphaerales bacterium]